MTHDDRESGRRNPLAQAQNFFMRIASVAGALIAGAWRRILMVMLVDLIGIISGAAIVLVIYVIARGMETGEWPQIGAFNVILEPARIWIPAIVVVGLGILSAACLYLSEWMISRIVDRHARKNAERVLRIGGDSRYRGWQALIDDEPLDALVRLADRTVRMMSFALHSLLRSMLPLGIFVVATVALFVIDPVLTAVLIPVAAVFAFPLVLVNRGVVQQHREYEEAGAAIRRSLRREVAAMLEQMAGGDSVLRVPAILRSAEFDSASRLFWRRKLATQRIRAVNIAFFAVAIAAMLLAFQGRGGDATWATFLAYLVAFRFSFSGLRQFTARWTILSRLYPEFAEYACFTQGAEEVRVRRSSAVGAEPRKQFAIRRINGPEPEQAVLTVSRGSALVLVAPGRAGSNRLETAVARLDAHCINPETRTPVDLLSNATVASTSCHQSELMASSTGADHPVFVIDAVRYMRMTAAARRDLVRGRFVLVVANNDRQIAKINVDESVAGAVVLSGRCIAAAGDRNWFLKHRHETGAGIAKDDDTSDDVLSDDDLDEDEDDLL